MLTNPLYGEIQTLRTEDAEYRNALVNSRQLAEVRDSLLAKYRSLDPVAVERLKKIVPDSVDNLKLIIELTRISESHSIVVKNVQFDPNKEKEQKAQLAKAGQNVAENTMYETFELDFIVEGTYANFLAFLSDVERSLRIVDVKSVDFSSVTNSVFSENYTYNVTIKTYRLKN
jgi:Tfp pilus assembly protein PilO